MKIQQIIPTKFDIENQTQKSFEVEIHTNDGVYNLDCIAECEYSLDHDAQGMELKEMYDKKILIANGHFQPESGEIENNINEKDLEEILIDKIELL